MAYTHAGSKVGRRANLEDLQVARWGFEQFGAELQELRILNAFKEGTSLMLKTLGHLCVNLT